MNRGTENSSLTLRRATEDDYDAIFDLCLEGYTETEPVAVALGITKEQAAPYLHGFLQEYLPMGYSLVLECGGEVVGTDLIRLTTRDQVFENELDPSISPNIQQLERMVQKASEGIWDLVPSHCNLALHGSYTVVRKDFIHKGGTLLVDGVLRVAQEENADIIIAECLSENAVKAARRIGCVMMRAIPYSAWKDEHGNQIVKHPKHSHVYLYVAFLKPTVPNHRAHL